MSLPRRLQALLVVVSLAGAASGLPASAVAQNAGDNQYQDPLQTTTTGKPAPAPRVTTPDVSQIPQLTPSAGPAPRPAPRPPAPAPAPAPRPLPSALPNTGMDARILAAAGLGLLLCGFGLRLRTARERF